MSRRHPLTVTEIVRDPGADERSDAYAAPQLAALDEWADQDPEAYRSMAAPRRSDTESDAYCGALEPVDQDLDRPEGHLIVDDLSDLDSLESFDPLGVSVSLLEEAGLLPPAPSRVLEPAEVVVEEVVEVEIEETTVLDLDDPMFLDADDTTVLDLETVDDPFSELTDEFITPLRDEDLAGRGEPHTGPMLVPVPLYEELSGGFEVGEVLAGLGPPVPARIARRLWRRDVERLAG